VTDSNLLSQLVSALSALAAGGDLVTLNSFVSQLAPAVLADVVIMNMRHLPAAPPPVGHTAADVAKPGLMSLFGAPAPTSAPASAPGAGPMPVTGAAAAGMAPSAAANAPAPLVAQQLGTEARAAQRLAAAQRILRADERKNVTGTCPRMRGGAPFHSCVRLTGCVLLFSPHQRLVGRHSGAPSWRVSAQRRRRRFGRGCWIICWRIMKADRRVARLVLTSLFQLAGG
jgi:hypothetical protein